ncbi:MAG: outer membrane lipoprotein-sorting protein [Acidobacteriia bacterium]|nr:outer membrane lipoprotein-sorting protein [Terriglobia bacterium]
MRKLSLFFVALFLFAFVAQAQTVDEIVAKNIAAKGGLSKLKALQTARITGSSAIGEMQAGFVLVQKRPDKVRQEISIQGLTMVQAYDGKNGWQIVPFTGKKDPEPMSGDELKAIQEQADFDSPLVDYKQKGHKVELVGKEQVDKAGTFHLRLTLKNGSVRELYLDDHSFLEIKTEEKINQGGQQAVSVSTMGDYKEVEGMMVPFSIEQRIKDGQGPGQKLAIQKVEFNVRVDDSVFVLPAPAPQPAPK